MNSDTAKTQATVKCFIDGDTTHFHVPTSVDPSGILKARYLAINTPESTSEIEEWGLTASNYNKFIYKNPINFFWWWSCIDSCSPK